MTEYLLNDPNRPVGLLAIGDPVYDASARVLQVGADQAFTTIAAAVAAARDGDVILVAAGTYTNDFVTVTRALTIIGVGGMVNMVATIPCPDGKAIMTVDQDLTLRNFSFRGAAVSASQGGNGAGIRYEGGKLTLVNDAFFGNQNGIMGGEGDPTTKRQIVINHCLFSGNGSGSGTTHNVYVGAVDSLTATNSIFENAVVGHEFKSRALSNTITGNLFRDGPTGTASYDIDLPNGGLAVVTGNVIEKGPAAENNAMVHYGGEALPYADSSLLLQGNTFVNDKGSGALGVLNQSGIPVTIQANTFVNLGATAIVNGPATVAGNVDQDGAPLADSANTDPVPGSTLTFLDGRNHVVTLDPDTLAVRGGAGRLAVFAQAGHVMAIGGAGGMTFQEAPDSGANRIVTAAGSRNTLKLTGDDTIDSRGSDLITTGAVAVSGSISGSAWVQDGTADNRWTVSGKANVNGHGGDPALTLLSGAQVSLSGTLASLRLNDTGGTIRVGVTQAAGSALAGEHISFSITGGSTSGYIYDGNTDLTTSGGPQGATIRLGDGVIKVTSEGRDTIWAGTGADTLLLSGPSEVHAGSGTLSVFGRQLRPGSEAHVYGNGGSTVLDGDTGNLFYYGGDKANQVTSRLSFATLFGGKGRMLVHAGSSDRIVGGSGGLDYYASADGGSTVTTAAGSASTLRLGGGTGVDSWGRFTIIGGTGDDSIVVHGNATIGGGTGSRTITLMGKDVLSGIGQDRVSVTAGADATITAGSLATVDEAGATVRLSVGGPGAGSMTVTGGGATLHASATDGLGIETSAAAGTGIRMGAGSVWIDTGGADTIQAGSGATRIQLGSAGVSVQGGSGAISLRALNGSATGLHFAGGSGDVSMLIAGGNDVVFGSGTTFVEAQGATANRFEFVAGQGGGTDLIDGFRAGVDQLVLRGVTVSSQSVAGGAANLVLSDGTRLQLTGVDSLDPLFG